jgi:hypothetical protein
MKDQPDRPTKRLHLTVWEKQIITAFIERYPSSAAAALAAADNASSGAVLSGGGKKTPAEVPPAKAPRPLRIKPDRIVPGIDRALPDDRESFLEAAESLEGRGLLSLIWARHRKGETLTALVCRDLELLYEFAGKPSPKTVAEDARKAARTFAAGTVSEEAALFSFLAKNFTPLDAAGGIDMTALADLYHLTGFLFDRNEPWQETPLPGPSPLPGPAAPVSGTDQRPETLWQGKVRGITTRALSVALYGNSKRLEALMTLFNPLFVRARRQGIVIPDFSFLDRSFPETFIAGKIALDFEDAPAGEPAGNGETARPPENATGEAGSQPCGSRPLINAGGNILGLPLETILKIRRIRPLPEATAVLMIENKETFFALAQTLPPLPDYTCFLYVGGHPNRAVRALASLLAESGFSFSHAGDLDPDGILILQELADITGKEVKPLRMDVATFDHYLECGRQLEPSMLRRTVLISEKIRVIPGMAELIKRIEETGMGVEQEIIDYRG